MDPLRQKTKQKQTNPFSVGQVKINATKKLCTGNLSCHCIL